MAFEPFSGNRQYSPGLSPGFGTGNPYMDAALSMLVGSNVFPQPQGDDSVFDTMIKRARNVNYHYIMRRATATSQMAARMGGINMDSPFYNAVYPFLASPESPLWNVMAPMIGGNPVKAQMGLYADLTGQNLLTMGRMGNISAFQTDMMMDQLQGRFYNQTLAGSRGVVPGGINYNYTRGFNLEDITGGFGAAARFSLMSRKTGLDIGRFGEAGIGAMDAARGVFGRDLSGKQLVSEIDKFLGTDHINMADDGSSRKLEELLRNVKGMARVAGIQISSIKGIIDEAKALAAQNPNLPLGLGGMSATTMALGAITHTSAALAYMTPENIRRLGGPAAMTSAAVAGSVQSMGEPASMQLAALASYMRHSFGPKSSQLQQVLEFAQSGDTSRPGLSAFYGTLAKSTGISAYQLANYANNNPAASALGFQEHPEVASAGQSALINTAFRQANYQFQNIQGISSRLFKIALDPALASKSSAENMEMLSKEFPTMTADTKGKVQRYLESVASHRANGGGTMSLMEISRSMGLAGPAASLFQQLAQSGGEQRIVTMFNPEAKAIHDEYQAFVKNNAASDAYYSKQNAEMNAPLIQRTLQSFIDGKFDTQGMEALRNAVSGGKGITGFADAAKRTQAAEAILGPNSFNSAGVYTNVSDAKAYQALDALFKGKDFAGLSAVGGKVGIDALRRISRYSGDLDAISTQLGSGSYSRDVVKAYLSKQTGIPAAVAAAAGMAGGKQIMSKEEIGALLAGISSKTNDKEIADLVNPLAKTHGLSPDAIKNAAVTLAGLDPNGLFAGDFSPTGLLNFGMNAMNDARLAVDDRAKVTKLLNQYEGLNKGSTASKLSMLKSVFDKVDFSNLEKGMKAAGGEDLRSLGKLSPADALAKAKQLLGKGATDEQANDLIRAAADLGTIDPNGLYSGKKGGSLVELFEGASSGLAGSLKRTMQIGFIRGIGDRSWKAMVSQLTANNDKTSLKMVEDINKLIGGKANMADLTDAMSNNQDVQNYLAANDPDHKMRGILDKYASSFESQKGMAAAEGFDEMANSTGNLLSSKNIEGIIKALQDVASAVNKASALP